MKKIFFIGQIESDSALSGPGQVLHNIVEVLSDEYDVSLINTYSKSILEKCFIFCKILNLLFKRNIIINVHSFGYFIPYLVYIISKLNKKNEYYLTLHGISSLECEASNFDISKKQLFLEKKIIEKFPNIIVVSNFLKLCLESDFNRYEHVYVIQNGVKIPTIYEICDTSSVSFLSAGGIDARKGILETCELVSDLISHGLDIKLIVCGSVKSNRLYTEFKQFILDHNLSNNIVYMGMIEHDVLLKLMSNCSYTISLTKFDTFNLTILESLSVGTPVIVTENAGVSEIIKDDCGLILKKQWKIDEVIKYISIEKSAYQNRCGESFALSKKYSWKEISNKYIYLFKGEFDD